MSKADRGEERRLLTVLLDYLRRSQRGQWCIEAEPDPPDFILKRRDGHERAVVEVTRFEWSPRVLGWQAALRGIMTRVSDLIADQVEGQFLLMIEVPDQQAFSSYYRSLSGRRREKAATHLAEDIVVVAGTTTIQQPKPVKGPPSGLLARLGYSGTGRVTWGTNVCVGDNLLDVAAEVNCVLARKAKSVRAFRDGSRILLVEYRCGLSTTLEAVARNVTLPCGVDEVYYVLPTLEVRDHRSLVDAS